MLPSSNAPVAFFRNYPHLIQNQSSYQLFLRPDRHILPERCEYIKLRLNAFLACWKRKKFSAFPISWVMDSNIFASSMFPHRHDASGEKIRNDLAMENVENKKKVLSYRKGLFQIL